MAEAVSVDPEWLRRLASAGEDAELAVFPDVLPDDLPVALPDGPLRVLGSVRQVSPRFAFHAGAVAAALLRSERLWRVYLDVPLPPPEVRRRWTEFYGAQGWQASQMFPSAFTGEDAGNWQGVHEGLGLILTLAWSAGVPGIALQLTAQEAAPEHIGQFLGRHFPHPHFDLAPMPTLMAPGGWTVRPLGGSGGAERSETAALTPTGSVPADPGPLQAAFLSQLAEQGWELLEATQADRDWRSVHRTPQGYGVLCLRGEDRAVQARIVHVTFPADTQGSVSSYTIHSP